MSVAKVYKIGELASRIGLSVDTLRYYEKHGLLVPAQRSEAGYRLYSEADLQRLGFIRRAKQAGFTLKEISELLDLEVVRDSASCEDVKQLVQARLARVEHSLRELERVRQSLQALSDACVGGDEPASHCTILDTLSHADE